MGMAESANLSMDEQYGGCHKKQSQSVFISKSLYLNISRQMLMISAYMGNDDRDYYNCIDTTLGSMKGHFPFNDQHRILDRIGHIGSILATHVAELWKKI